MSDNIVHIPVNMDYAKRGDPTTLAFLRQSAERREKEAGNEIHCTVCPSCTYLTTDPKDIGQECMYCCNAIVEPLTDEIRAMFAEKERTCEDSESSSH